MQSRNAGRSARPGEHLALLALGTMVLGAGVTARAANVFGSPVPDWVKTAAQEKLPEFHGNPKAVVLLEQTTYTVDAKGQAVEHVRRVVKILRPQGRDYGYPVVSYDKDSKVLSLHAWSIDAAGHEYTVKDDEVSDVGQPGESGELYSDARARVADPPGRDPGGIIAYEYEKRSSRMNCHGWCKASRWCFRQATAMRRAGRGMGRWRGSIWRTIPIVGR
jgi:hypothetical protein